MSKKPPAGPLTFSATVGRQVRKLREEAGRSQDELAVAGRRAGLMWTRGSVASLETGRRGLGAEEFLVLPLVLRILTGRNQWRLADLLPDNRRYISLPLGGERISSLKLLVAGKSVAALDSPAATARPIRPIKLEEQGEAVRHAAKRLEVEPGTVSRVAERLWRRSLTEEREQRVAERGGTDASTRSLQALRGHVSRELINELRHALEEEKEGDG